MPLSKRWQLWNALSRIFSQVSAGEANGLTIKIYGEKGGLEWVQESPNTLTQVAAK